MHAKGEFLRGDGGLTRSGAMYHAVKVQAMNEV